MFPKSCLEAAPKVSQSQPQSDIPISKPFAVMGGHPGPESGTWTIWFYTIVLHCVSALMCPSCASLCVMFCCFPLQVQSSRWLWASSSPLCCCSWSAVVSNSFVTSWRKPVPSPQRSQITSSMACTCSQSVAGSKYKCFEIWEREPWEAWARTFWIFWFVLTSGWKHPNALLSWTFLNTLMNVWLVNLLLIDAAFKATDTYSDACEFIFMLS